MKVFYSALLWLAEFELAIARSTGRYPANIHALQSDVDRWRHALQSDVDRWRHALLMQELNT